MAESSHRKRIPGARLVWLFRAAPAPVQRALVSAGRRVPSIERFLPGSLPVGSFNCVILAQVLQFLSPETALANVWASLPPGGVRC